MQASCVIGLCLSVDVTLCKMFSYLWLLPILPRISVRCCFVLPLFEHVNFQEKLKERIDLLQQLTQQEKLFLGAEQEEGMTFSLFYALWAPSLCFEKRIRPRFSRAQAMQGL